VSGVPASRWNDRAGSRAQVAIGEGHVEVVGSGVEASRTPVLLNIGPSSLCLEETEAVALAEGLIRAVNKRRAEFSPGNPTVDVYA
jgi:hypothetical protein